MPKQVGHINTRSLLRWATFDSFSKFIKLNFGFVSHKIFLARLFCARRVLRPRAAAPSAPPSYATARGLLSHNEHNKFRPLVRATQRCKITARNSTQTEQFD